MFRNVHAKNVRILLERIQTCSPWNQASATPTILHGGSSHKNKRNNYHTDQKNEILESFRQLVDKVQQFRSFQQQKSAQTKASLADLTEQIFTEYHALPTTTLERNISKRQEFILALASCSTDMEQVRRSATHLLTTLDSTDRDLNPVQALQGLQHSVTPLYYDIVRNLFQHNVTEAIRLVLALRQDLVQWTQGHPTPEQTVLLKSLDRFLQEVLSNWFAPGALTVERIKYETTPAAIIEQVARYEAVHPVKSLDDLRARLGPSRRVFGLAHPLLPNQLLVVLHVALRHEIPTNMDQIQNDAVTNSLPKVAAFYSISNLHNGLGGIGLGEYLIQQAVRRLQDELPTVQTFVTLSPIPRFRKWLEERVYASGKFAPSDLVNTETIERLSTHFNCAKDQVLLKMLDALTKEVVQNDELVQSVLLRLAARYLVTEKHRRKPLDGVARFHVGNGASLHRINYAADLSRKGWQNSYGIMVNYLYDMEAKRENQANYEADYAIHVSNQVNSLLGD